MKPYTLQLPWTQPVRCNSLSAVVSCATCTYVLLYSQLCNLHPFPHFVSHLKITSQELNIKHFREHAHKCMDITTLLQPPTNKMMLPNVHFHSLHCHHLQQFKTICCWIEAGATKFNKIPSCRFLEWNTSSDMDARMSHLGQQTAISTLRKKGGGRHTSRTNFLQQNPRKQGLCSSFT